ncbi:MAG TPA: cytochrome c oxidase subunit II [Solirubrobacteraceae bacterium]|jgi:cytochrome c oxidase subunit 2|nr:cytochrome c oxidase subunit II [Solirubrobacteraceae bacterium]
MRDNPPVRWLVIGGVVACAIGITLGLTINWFPVEASKQSDKIDALYNVLIIASVPFFVLVASVVIFSVVAFRMRPGEENLDGPPIHGNTKLEIGWTAGPSMLILGLVVYSLIVLHDIGEKPPGTIQVGVTGRQFAFSYQYPSSLTHGKPLDSNELYIPDGKTVDFYMTSLDVIHAFWVPAFRVQQSLVPGITTHLIVDPDRLGTYDVICNQLCGVGHSLMRSEVHVVTPAQFQTWLTAQVKAEAVSGPTVSNTE